MERGASMSGDLKAPSKSIPKGTLYGLALTFATYTIVIISMAASITRVSFYNNDNVLQVILLFINDPRRQYKLIQFCNSLKKGALFVLGHVIVTNDFAGAVPEVKKQQSAWTKYIDFSRIKAFISIVISPNIEWGTRNVVLSAGLGGMKPNIVVMGFYNLNDLRTNPLINVPSPRPEHPQDTLNGTAPHKLRSKGKWKIAEENKLNGQLPTDVIRKESAVTPQSYVTILEDLLLRLQMNVAIAKGFQDLELPAPGPSKLERMLEALHVNSVDEEEGTKRYIDLWPIQMSAEVAAPTDGTQNILTTNFDTYTLILQLGCILNTVPSWKRAYRLRVAVFVEYDSDVEEERGRVKALLYNLRIEAEVLVFWLASGDLQSYEIIVNGKSDESCHESRQDIEEALKEEAWWQDIHKLRQRKTGAVTPMEELAQLKGFLETASNWPSTAFRQGDRETKSKRFADIKEMLIQRRRTSIGSLKQMGVSMGMRTHRLPPGLDGHESSSDSSSSDGGFEAGCSDSDRSAASENDLDELQDEPDTGSISPIRRTCSEGGSINWADSPRLRRQRHSSTSPFSTAPRQRSPPRRANLLHPTQAAAANSDSTLLTSQPPPNAGSTPQPNGSETNLAGSRQSPPRFTSMPVPATEVTADEGPGPSIMFAEPRSPEELRERRVGASIYTRSGSPQVAAPPQSGPAKPDEGASVPTPVPGSPGAASPVSQASGFPLQQSVPLSFNDLPCRAQHLILNELIRRESGKDQRTAVIFTTLPSPVEGTCEDEHASVRYLADLEVLCQGLPPVVLVHSNSMTVTTNL
ncbi:hypothetical protein SLS58_008831 [Diplodia intermedia]|uniref:SLC12A transporter C-terminal domain-containing protein n=1 Tax=Diplodia intermedia TaxID=856260 RepID=A0ABR3TG04_9PEZI